MASFPLIPFAGVHCPVHGTVNVGVSSTKNGALVHRYCPECLDEFFGEHLIDFDGGGHPKRGQESRTEHAMDREVARWTPDEQADGSGMEPWKPDQRGDVENDVNCPVHGAGSPRIWFSLGEKRLGAHCFLCYYKRVTSGLHRFDEAGEVESS